MTTKTEKALDYIRESFMHQTGIFDGYTARGRADEFDEVIAQVRRDAARAAWAEGQASGWRSTQEEWQMNGSVGDLYHPHTETEPNPYDTEEPA